MNLFVSLAVSRSLWTDHVLEWWNHKDDPNVLFLKFEDLQKVCWSEVWILFCTRLLIYSSERRFRACFLAPFQSLRKKPLVRGCFLAFSSGLSAFQAFSQWTRESGTSNPIWMLLYIYLCSVLQCKYLNLASWTKQIVWWKKGTPHFLEIKS